MRNLILLICSIIPLIVDSQNIQVSGFYVSFGTGDILGYGTGVSVNKNLIKKPKLGLSQLLAGGELIFENGVDEPKIYNTTQNEIAYTERFFNHVTGTTLWGKLSYHPFHKILPGFHIAVGPSIGYWKRSGEKYAALGTRTKDGIDQLVRMSILGFDNGFVVGYRISAGLNFDIKRMYIGGRVDFSNNQKSEINSILGLTLGYKLK